MRYIDVEDANSLVATLYLSTSEEVVAWNSLEVSDKEVLLNRATTIIDGAVYDGLVLVEGQALQFPRITNRGVIYINDDIKKACVTLALLDLTNKLNRHTNIQNGITSVKVGSNSETYTNDNPFPVEVMRYLFTYLATSIIVV